MLKISEVFFGIQGEGQSMGKPKLFIRLSGCNLKCKWCDTKYHIKGRELNSNDSFLLGKYKNWVITGGEPLLQQEAILNLIKEYEPYFVDIETNGTIIPRFDLALKVNCFNISPKEQRFQPKHCRAKIHILDHPLSSDDYIIKFVYSDKDSERFITRVINENNISPHEVWIMPEGQTRKEILTKQKQVWNYCLKHNYNYSSRLQIEVWDKKRGV